MNLFLTSAQLFALQDFNWRTGLVCITYGLLWFSISMLLINTVCSLQTSSTAEIMACLSCTQPFCTILDSFRSFWLVPVKLTDPDVRLKLYQRNSLDQIVQNNSDENTRSLCHRDNYTGLLYSKTVAATMFYMLMMSFFFKQSSLMCNDKSHLNMQTSQI